MEVSSKILSDITVYSKYARYLPEKKRRETWEEVCDRVCTMHAKKFPELAEDIREVFAKWVKTKKVLPSMRTAQFAGGPIEKSNVRGYNCTYLSMDDWRAFSEVMFLLLSGCGVGYSVQSNHVDQLPEIKHNDKQRRYLIGDSIEGWADAIRVLMRSYFEGRPRPRFDFSDIRPKGARLVSSGGKAPGPEPLRECIYHVTRILEQKDHGSKLTPLEVHEINCYIADAVLAGGIRRSAAICLFDVHDQEMMECKTGTWWEEKPHLGRCNNSAVFVRHLIDRETYDRVFDVLEKGGSGEPGFFLTNDPNIGTNPCVIGSTPILTDKGYREIQDCVGEKISIWNGEHWASVTPFSTGHNEVVQVDLSDGSSLVCTWRHRFVLDGREDFVMAADLEEGDKLKKFDYPVVREGETYSTDAYSQGFYAGDGNKGYDYSWVYEPKYSCIPRLVGEIPEYESFGRRTWKHGPMLDRSFVPINGSLEYKINWLAGLLDADGTLTRNKNSCSVQMVSVDFEFLTRVRLMLTTLGVGSKICAGSPAGFRQLPDGHGGLAPYYCKTAFRIMFGATQLKTLEGLGLVFSRLEIGDNNPQRDASRFVCVESVTPLHVVTETFCFTESLTSRGTFNGVITGNCGEIALVNGGCCNLNDVDISNVEDQEELEARIRAASFLGTLQASYTDFHYLRDMWKQNAEKEALLGVAMTGIASLYPRRDDFDFAKAAQVAVEENKRVAGLIGINPARRVTTVKPSGTASLVVGSSSGVHAWHAPHYMRRMRFGKDEALTQYLHVMHPELVEDEFFRPTQQSVVGVPVAAPAGAITRQDETALDVLERVRFLHDEWIKPGHIKGSNTHNVSVTVNVRPDEWKAVREWMWANQESYAAIALLPYDGGNFTQAPFEDITAEEYEERLAHLVQFDITKVLETDDDTDLQGEVACAGGLCEIT